MKKILFIAALILSASSYSAISISGGGLSGNYKILDNSSGGKDLSGVISFTGARELVIRLETENDYIKEGTKFILEPGQTVKIETKQGFKSISTNFLEKSYYEFRYDFSGEYPDDDNVETNFSCTGSTACEVGNNNQPGEDQPNQNNPNPGEDQPDQNNPNPGEDPPIDEQIKNIVAKLKEEEPDYKVIKADVDKIVKKQPEDETIEDIADEIRNDPSGDKIKEKLYKNQPGPKNEIITEVIMVLTKEDFRENIGIEKSDIPKGSKDYIDEATFKETGEVNLYIPRSRVNLDLVRNIKATTFKNLEKSKENSYTIDAEYIGGLGGSYKDKSQKIKYSSTSNGMSLTGTRNFGSITLGATFGYQESEVKYKNLLNNVREDIDTYQLGLSFRHNFTKEIDLTLSMTYGEGKHKFKTVNGLGNINGASFKSKIYDFEARLGRKYTFTNAYIKPYLGIGTTKVDEKKIEKLNMDRSKKTEGYAILGTYGALNFGKLDLFGNIEYTQRLEKDSYHAKRYGFNSSYNMAPLNYSRAEYNFSLGARYNITEAFNVSTNYELDNLKNSIIKVGFGLEF